MTLVFVHQHGPVLHLSPNAMLNCPIGQRLTLPTLGDRWPIGWSHILAMAPVFVLLAQVANRHRFRRRARLMHLRIALACTASLPATHKMQEPHCSSCRIAKTSSEAVQGVIHTRITEIKTAAAGNTPFSESELDIAVKSLRNVSSPEHDFD